MSLERWQAHDKVVAVRPKGEHGLEIRPRRLSPWSSTFVGTSLAAGFSLSAAIARLPGLRIDSEMMLGCAAAILASAMAASLRGAAIRGHPERWRFLAWWAAFLLAKIPFLVELPILILPFELIALMPAYRLARESAKVLRFELRETDARDLDVSFVQFLGTDFTCTDLSGSHFSEVRFERCRFSGAMMAGVRFSKCVFAGCDFTDARLVGSQWSDVDARDSLFVCAILTEAVFSECDLRHCDFERADLQGTRFGEAGRPATRLEGARMAGARYDSQTVWSGDAMPIRWGAAKVD